MEPERSPRISVVVTCYNLGRYLDEALDSVFAQTFQDFDVVIVNDGSTDAATNDLLRDYRRDRTRVIHSENRGLPGARNLGIQNTRGTYLCCLDADDKLEASYFEKAVRILDHDPTIAFVSHWLRNFGDEESDWTPSSCDLPSLLIRNTVNGAALVRRSALQAVGGFDERMVFGCEDWDLWITMLEHGLKGTIIPEVLFFYRRRHDSMSRLMMNGDSHNQLFRFIVDKHADSYRANLLELVLAKEASIGHLLKENHDLELEHETWTVPAIQRANEDIVALEAKSGRMAADATKAARIESLQGTGTARQDTVTSLQEQVTNLQEQTKIQQEEATKALQEQVKTSQEQTTTQQLQVRALQEHVLGLERGVGERDASIHAYQRESSRLEATVAAQINDIADLQRRLALVYASVSWRLTAPVRLIFGWLRR